MNIRYNELSEQWTFGIFLPPYFLKIGPSDNRALTNKFSDNRAFWQSGFWQTGYLTIGPSDNKADTTGLERKISRFLKVRIFYPIRDFFYLSISLKVLGYLINTLNRQRVDFEHDRTFFELLRFFYFREVSILRANIWRKLPKRVCTRRIHTANLWWNFSSKSVQPSSCTGCDARTDGRTNRHTNR